MKNFTLLLLSICLLVFKSDAAETNVEEAAIDWHKIGECTTVMNSEYFCSMDIESTHVSVISKDENPQYVVLIKSANRETTLLKLKGNGCYNLTSDTYSKMLKKKGASVSSAGKVSSTCVEIEDTQKFPMKQTTDIEEFKTTIKDTLGGGLVIKNSDDFVLDTLMVSKLKRLHIIVIYNENGENPLSCEISEKNTCLNTVVCSECRVFVSTDALGTISISGQKKKQ